MPTEGEVRWEASGVGKGQGWAASAGWGRLGPRTDGPARGTRAVSCGQGLDSVPLT